MSFDSFKQSSGNLNCLADIWYLWWDQITINNRRGKEALTPLSLLHASLHFLLILQFSVRFRFSCQPLSSANRSSERYST